MAKLTIEPEKLKYALRDARQAFPRLLMMDGARRGFVEEIESVQREARRFGEKYVAPAALEIDRRTEEDSTYFAWDLVREGAKRGYLSFIIPKPFSGRGMLTTHFAVLMEELCSFCPGVANIFGAHALGISPLLLTPDIRQYSRYMQSVALAEKRGEPELFSLAHTEPAAGSDIEDSDDMADARLVTHARKVKGGYILNGRKVFISNGSVAKYHWVGAVMDRKRPVETTVTMVVTTGTKGFSVGRIEKKLGQRACPASELIFEDVFVPEEDRVGDEGEGDKLIPLVLGGSRGPVAAIATGTARGAFERLLDYVNVTKSGGRYLFEHQWCQLMLADMLTKIQVARQLYFDAVTACDMLGVPKLMGHPAMKSLEFLPRDALRSDAMKRLFRSENMYSFVRGLAGKNVRERDVPLIAAYGSIAKYSAGDIAVEITSKAMDVMGEDGAAVEFGVEKLYRDAKLTQIYEGTNQVNRLFVYKNCLGRRR